MRLLLDIGEDILQISEEYIARRANRLCLWISGTGEGNLQWFLDSVLQVTYSIEVQQQLWSYLLYDLVKYPDDHRETGLETFVSELLRRCSVESARSVLWRLFDPCESHLTRLTYLWGRPTFTDPQIFRLLVEKTSGLKFLRTLRDHRNRQQSLLSYALESYTQWRLLERAMNQSTFEVSELIKGDLDLYQCGWTTEGT